MRRTSIAAALLAAAAIVGILAAGCGDDDDNTGTTANTNAGVISAIDILDKAGLHDFDTQLAAGTVPATAQSVATKLQTVTLLTPWPAELQGKATALAGIFGTMAKALDSDKPDLAAAGQAAHNAHEGEHEFSDAVWTYLESQAHVSGGTPAADDDEDGG